MADRYGIVGVRGSKENTRERISIPAENQYQRKSKDEIRQIALDNMTGAIFGSWQLSENDASLFGMIFLPIFFSQDYHHKEMERDGIVHFFGHLHDSLNRSINGRPIFHTFQTINEEDLRRVFKMQKLLAAVEEEDD